MVSRQLPACCLLLAEAIGQDREAIKQASRLLDGFPILPDGFPIVCRAGARGWGAGLGCGAGATGWGAGLGRGAWARAWDAGNVLGPDLRPVVADQRLPELGEGGAWPGLSLHEPSVVEA